MFVDETGASTKMTRLYGRRPRGERLVAPVPWGHWKTTTFIGALRQDGLVAPCAFDGPMNGEKFRAWVEQFLVPELKPGDRPRQSVQPQGRGRQNGDRERRRLSAVLACLQPRPQPDRAVVRQAQSAPAQGRGANLQRSHRRDRQRARSLHPARMRKLSRKLRISTPSLKILQLRLWPWRGSSPESGDFDVTSLP